MTAVGFQLHRIVDDDVAELDEATLGDTALAPGERLDGAIVIEGDAQPAVTIVDDLGSAVQRLCFEAVGVLLQPGASYGYLYFTQAVNAQLDATAETIAIRGEDIPTAVHPRDPLLLALYGCGRRYLDWLSRLGDRGPELAHLGRYADRARDALLHAGLL